MSLRPSLLLGAALLLAPAVAATGAPGGAAPRPGSPAYLSRDAANMAAAFGRQTGPDGQLRDPAYLSALALAIGPAWAGQLVAQAGRPTHPAVTGGNLVPGWNLGDPRRRGWSGHRGLEHPVAFPDRYGALLQGDLFAPRPAARDPYTGARLHAPFPGVVVVTGSIQAPAGVYDWLAEDLAERGYLVLTFDVQGQGRSETLPHQGGPTGLPYCDPAAPARPGQLTGCPGVPSEQNQNFVDDTEDAVTFFLSTPTHRYRGGYDPWWRWFDRVPDPHPATPGRTTRLALVGHSTGAVVVSYLQGVDRRVATAVALDKLTATPAAEADVGSFGPLPGGVVPRVPALSLQSEYGFEPQPYWLASCSSFDPCPGSPEVAPDPSRERRTGFDEWRRAGVDSMLIVPRASTHLEYADVPLVLPASADGQAMASYYLQAWLAKYLRHDPGADRLLLSRQIRYLQPVGDGVWRPESFARDAHLSFYFCSAYAFRLSDGRRVVNGDVVDAGCR